MMAWTTPKTDFADGNVLTAAQMNNIGNNLQYLYDSGGQIISTTTLTGAAVDITVPSGLQMVRLIVENFKPSTAARLGCKMNGSTGPWYYHNYVQNGVAGYQSDGANAFLTVSTCQATGTPPGTIMLDFPNYEDTSVNGHLVIMNGHYYDGSSQLQVANQTIFFSTTTAAAITSIRLNAPTAANQTTPTATMSGTAILIGY